ncbi:MAG: 16S rRNA (cytosine(1402)-N(4))-methyltransferase RsmH [Betaproteobacteria bacterium]|nr:MAG: 16S rRNA (cytosine(1402)-N(4))-methyltransferase RsmH [Betaproteobacteria bacterium]
MGDGGHVPVLLEEAVAALAVKPGGTYVDATFGRGGHSRRILAQLDARGRLIALDRDPAAEAVARAWSDARFRFHRAQFSELPQILDAERIGKVDGVLLDLGVSSPQIDDPHRGFSLRADGPLDMRMDPTRGTSAADWLAAVTEHELRRVIADYGEERFAQQIARAIVAARAHEPLVRTRQLAAIVAKAVRARGRSDRSQDPATRTFQALRIHINQELTELSLALEPVLPRLAIGGRLAVISFHSLEDRLVKQFLRKHAEPYGGDARVARLPIATRALPVPPLRLVGRAIRPGADEIAANPRSRSARLRIAERTAAGPSPW